MRNYGNFKILKNKRLIVEYYSGIILLDDFISLHTRKGNHPDFNKNFNLLIDFRDANIQLSKEDIYALIAFHQRNEKLLGERIAAHLTLTPRQVVSSSNFDIYNEVLPIRIAVFSTLGAALNWVGLGYNDQAEIQACLDAFKVEASAVD